MPGGPYVWAAGATVVAGFGVAAWILRGELRYQRRQRRRGGFLAGGDR
jgi:hypothetical protein